MSVTMTKANGVAVFTLTSDPKSPWPPLWQILNSLCCNPLCCSVSQRLRGVQTPQTVLGALQIMVGLLNIGFGVILCNGDGGSWWQMDCAAFPFWLGGFFVLFGIMSILSEKFPSPCLVILSVILNLSGVGFAIAAIILYSINLAVISLRWMYDLDDYDYLSPSPSPSPEEMIKKEKCMEGKELVVMLLRSINAVLIILSVLELCVAISSAVLGIKALRSGEKGEKKRIEDPEHYKPQLEGVTSNPAA
ncbi:membrane-spanning 4-domains subfamily A member 6C-like [Enoplosus armatus]|uniref:membrane-spanning 4-domains subfamily A member 6C-like n=1 Tax=Enoplosus armatus TaxID=215367 RepID=UPI0039933C39